MNINLHINNIIMATDTDMVDSVLDKIKENERDVLLCQLNKIKPIIKKNNSIFLLKNINRAFEILE